MAETDLLEAVAQVLREVRIELDKKIEARASIEDLDTVREGLDAVKGDVPDLEDIDRSIEMLIRRADDQRELLDLYEQKSQNDIKDVLCQLDDLALNADVDQVSRAVTALREWVEEQQEALSSRVDASVAATRSDWSEAAKQADIRLDQIDQLNREVGETLGSHNDALSALSDQISEIESAQKAFALADDVSTANRQLHSILAAHTRMESEIAEAFRVLHEENKHLKAALAGMATKEDFTTLRGEVSQWVESAFDRVNDLEKTVDESQQATCATVDTVAEELREALSEASTRSSDETEQLRIAVAKQAEDFREELSAAQNSTEVTIQLASAEMHERINGAIGEAKEYADSIAQQVDEAFEDVTETLVSVQGQIEETEQRIVDAWVQRYAEVEPWAAGGPAYKQYALVTHCGGLWQARTTNKVAPHPGPDWVLLSDGLAEVNFDGDEVRFKRTSGVESISKLELPYPRPQGVYDPNKTYKQWDAVIRDGYGYMTIVDDPVDAPRTESSQWVVLGGRGKAGRRGPPGETGPAGKAATAEEVAREVLRQQSVLEAEKEAARLREQRL